MKTQLFHLVTFMLLGAVLNAQSTNWAVNYQANEANEIIVDENDQIYSTGTFKGTVDFDPGAGEFPLSSVSSTDLSVFVQKLDEEGQLIWAKSFGNNRDAWPVSIKLHNSGVYILGTFEGTIDFDPGPDTYNLTSSVTAGRQGAFILKLDTEGNFDSFINGVSPTAEGDILLTGHLEEDTDIMPGTGELIVGISNVFTFRGFLMRIEIV